jgi:hypothetical protein
MPTSNFHSDIKSGRIIYSYDSVLDITYKLLSTQQVLLEVFIDRSKRKQRTVNSKNFSKQPKHFKFIPLNLFNR